MNSRDTGPFILLLNWAHKPSLDGVGITSCPQAEQQTVLLQEKLYFEADQSVECCCEMHKAMVNICGKKFFGPSCERQTKIFWCLYDSA